MPRLIYIFFNQANFHQFTLDFFSWISSHVDYTLKVLEVVESRTTISIPPMGFNIQHFLQFNKLPLIKHCQFQSQVSVFTITNKIFDFLPNKLPQFKDIPSSPLTTLGNLNFQVLLLLKS